MFSEEQQQIKMLSIIKDDIVECHQQNNGLMYLKRKSDGIFEDYWLAEILSSIQDDSYRYAVEYIRTHEPEIELLNVFSGSGRLIRELLDNGLADCCSRIHCVDSSATMISFERTLYKQKNIMFYCEDILDLKGAITYDVAICHCGIRYLPEQSYDRFITVLQENKRNRDSICLVTETNEHSIQMAEKHLRRRNIKYSIESRYIRVHRNSVLYDLFIRLRDSNYFEKMVRDLAVYQKKSISDILINMAGYKMSPMYILRF